MAMNFFGELTRFNRQGCERRQVKRLATLAGAAVLGLLAAGSEARAVVILSGNSTGSTLSNCVGTACGSSGIVTSLGLSSFTLSISTARPLSVSAPPTTTMGVGLAELEMVTGNNPSGTASFNYLITHDPQPI
jgi:hypothetical protein